jgi:cell wall-associated NlpC family hydrolase
MNTLDRRLTAARPDVAALHLQGQVEAARFVAGEPRRIIEPATPLRARPAADCGLETEALFGETFTVYDEHEGWAWGQLAGDGYVGYLSANALGAPLAPTHRVAALRTFLYPGPNLKLPAAGALSIGAMVTVTATEGAYSRTEAGWLHTGHLAPAHTFEADHVSVAERFLHVPYLWGGKTSLGLDCSGLVQVAMAAAGRSVPRDSDMQERAFPEVLPLDGVFSGLKRGDLVFWKGHVGLMRDATTLLHANGHHMAVASEPLAEAAARILAKSFGPVTSIRRP